MRHTSCVYQIGADLTAPLLNYVQEKNILFSNAGIKIAPILVTYAITPNNIFTWNALNLSIPLIFRKGQKNQYILFTALLLILVKKIENLELTLSELRHLVT